MDVLPELVRPYTRTPRAWHRTMSNYIRAWVEEHKDMRADTWTPGQGASAQ